MRCHAVIFAILILMVSRFPALATEPDTDKPLPGFWGIPFRSSLAECKKILLAKEGATLNEKDSSAEVLVVGGLVFGGHTTDFILLKFMGDKLYTAHVVFHASLEAKTQSLFDDIKTEVDGKYFKCQHYFRNFKTPFEDGDGYETTAIKNGKADIGAFWLFKGKDGISLKISPDLFVTLTYQNFVLSTAAKKDADEKHKKDF